MRSSGTRRPLLLQMKKEEVDNLIRTPEKFLITVFPIGDFGDTQAKSMKVGVDYDSLKNPLIKKDKRRIGKSLTNTELFREASDRYGALRDVHNRNQRGVGFDFLPQEGGCAMLITLITNEMQDEVVAAWAQSIKILPRLVQVPTGAVPTATERCEYPAPSAKLFYMTSVPSFPKGEAAHRPHYLPRPAWGYLGILREFTGQDAADDMDP